MTTTDTDRRATPDEIATARAWVERALGTSTRSIHSDDPDEQRDAASDAQAADAEYEYALAVLIFANDRKAPTPAIRIDRFGNAWKLLANGWHNASCPDDCGTSAVSDAYLEAAYGPTTEVASA